MSERKDRTSRNTFIVVVVLINSRWGRSNETQRSSSDNDTAINFAICLNLFFVLSNGREQTGFDASTRLDFLLKMRQRRLLRDSL